MNINIVSFIITLFFIYEQTCCFSIDKCVSVPDKKTNCFREDIHPTREECLSRNCCWSPDGSSCYVAPGLDSQLVNKLLEHLPKNATIKYENFSTEDVALAVKETLFSRYHLEPYVRTIFWIASQRNESTPIFQFPFDHVMNQLPKQDTSFTFGPALFIVSDFNHNETSVTSYFPSNKTWFDASTSKKITTNKRGIASFNASSDNISVFFGCGNIIAYKESAKSTSKSQPDSFGLYVTITSTEEFEDAFGLLYWDDGESDGVLGVSPLKANLLPFWSVNNTLIGAPALWNYSTPMILNTIRIIGNNEEVAQVLVDEKNYTNFKFNKENNELVIESLNIDLSQFFCIKWGAGAALSPTCKEFDLKFDELEKSGKTKGEGIIILRYLVITFKYVVRKLFDASTWLS